MKRIFAVSAWSAVILKNSKGTIYQRSLIQRLYPSHRQQNEIRLEGGLCQAVQRVWSNVTTEGFQKASRSDFIDGRPSKAVRSRWNGIFKPPRLSFGTIPPHDAQQRGNRAARGRHHRRSSLEPRLIAAKDETKEALKPFRYIT